MMAVLAAVHLGEVAGLGWLVACCVWSGGVWYVAYRALVRSLGRVDSARPIIAGFFVAFAVAMLPPFLAALWQFDIDLASSALYLAGIGPLGAAVAGFVGYQAVRYPFTANERRWKRRWDEFASRFKDGPVGTWRAEVFPGRVDNPDCELIFLAGGTGEFRQQGNLTPFGWRKKGELGIEVRTAGEDWLELSVSMDHGERATPIEATLSLFKREWLDNIPSTREEAIERWTEGWDDSHALWPVNERFVYVGDAPAHPTP